MKPPFTILVADIGGTNANFGILTPKDQEYQLIAHYQLASQKISNIILTIKDLLERLAIEQHLRVSAMVIGGAGFVSTQTHALSLTNLPWRIDKAALIKETGVTDILFVNDFMLVACGYPFVAGTLALTSVDALRKGQQAFLGAGTGLGQAYALWSEAAQGYVPLVSEGGHSNFVALDDFDRNFARFIQEQGLFTLSVSWEQILNGRGLQQLYQFLGTLADYPRTDISREIAAGRLQPDAISRYAQQDEQCQQAMRLYRRYYACYAQQVALQGVALGGLYIAGGIAAHNKELFTHPAFLHDFTAHVRHHKLLEKIPIFLIQDYQVSLYGGAHYYTLHTRGIV